MVGAILLRAVCNISDFRNVLFRSEHQTTSTNAVIPNRNNSAIELTELVTSRSVNVSPAVRFPLILRVPDFTLTSR
jgi:hypothetical protein